MPDIPPRQPVNGTASARVESAYGLPPLTHGDQPPDIDATGALVSLHQAATQSGPDSFPVLKAFQEYLESERQRARRRVALVTSLFAGIVVVLIAVFLAAGVLLFNYMKEREERLWRRLEAQAAAPAPLPAVEPAPSATASVALEQELNRLSEALAALTQERAAAGATAVSTPPPPPPTVRPAVTPAPVAPPPPAPVPTATVAATPPAPVPAAATPPAPAPAAAVHRPAALEIPPGVAPPAPPAGFAESGIYLRPGGRGAPIPWRVLVPAP
ncbi:MAG: hypothetical protein GX571_08820 [Lentisphaerae bacterium]|jgi:hypothetical protein|nr:hypothetical protein [Lentisphaerota bacterium]